MDVIRAGPGQQGAIVGQKKAELEWEGNWLR